MAARAAVCLGLALAALAPAGCALQSDVMEMEGQVAGIQALQKQLEQGVTDAKAAAESMRAVGFRMEAVENKLNERSDPAVEARIAKGIDDLQHALDGMEAQRKAIDDRLREAETFFTGRVEQVSARQQGLAARLADLEGDVNPSPQLRASRAEMAADLQSLQRKLTEQGESLKAVQGQFVLLTDNLARIDAQAAAAQAAAQTASQTASQVATQAAQPPPGPEPREVERLGLRLADVEARAAEAAQGRQRLADQLALLTGNLDRMAEDRQQAEAGKAALAQDAAGALDTRVATLEGRDAERARLEQGLAGQIGVLDQRLTGLAAAREQDRARAESAQAALAKDAAGALDGRLTTLEQRDAENAKARRELAGQIGVLDTRLTGLAAAREQDRARAESAQAALAQDAAGALDGRLTTLEQRDAGNAKARRELADRVAAITERLARLSDAGEEARAARANLSEQAAADLGARLKAIEADEAQAAEARRRLEEASQALAARLGQVTDAQAAQVAAAAQGADRLAARLDVLEKGGVDAAENRRQLASQVGQLADRLVAVEQGATAPDKLRAALDGLDARVATMEGAGGRVERLSELTDQLSVLGQQVTQRLDAQATDFTRLAARMDRMEAGVEAFQEAPPEWGKSLDQKVSFLAEEITPRVDTQGKELSALAGTLAATREQADLREAQMSDRVNTLGTSLVQRVDALEGRVTDVEKVPPGAAAPDADVQAKVETLGRQVDVLGGRVPAQVDALTDLVAQLRAHMDRVGERIALLETIQKQDSADLRERFNALSAALGELGGGARP